MASGSTRSEGRPRIVAAGSRLVLVVRGRHLGGITVAVAEQGGGLTSFQWRKTGPAWSGTASGLRCLLEGAAVPEGLVVSVALINAGAVPLTLRHFRFGVQGIAAGWGNIPQPLSGLKIGYCGAHSRSPHSRSAAIALEDGHRVRSWWVGALAPPRGGPGVVLGGAEFHRFATAVDLEADGLEAIEFLEGWALGPGERLDVAPLWLGVSHGPPLALLEAYASEVGRRHGVRPRRAPCGWGSWGHFLESIDADLMRENLLALDASRALRQSVRVIQIDDGWSELLETERASASWRPNRRFPSGIAPLADAIRQRGRECGLWFLPFTVNEGSALADTHPDYLVRDQGGRPKRLSGGSFCLDPCHTGARDWVGDLLGRVRDWGVSYVKLDHLRGLLMVDPDAEGDDLDAPRVHAERVTRVEAYRRGLALVRQALGADTFVVGCSAPAGPGAGLVDAHRVGPDIEPVWVGTQSGIRDAARALAANFFWQGRAWVNDPDYLLAGPSVEESRFWTTAVALSGGSAVISADLEELPRWQEELFGTVTPPTGRAARPLDLFERPDGPSVWHLAPENIRSGWHVVGLFNWTDRPGEFPLDLPALGLKGAVHVWDVWRRRHHAARGRDTVFVEPHAAALLNLCPAASTPKVVGTDVHFAPDAWVFGSGGERWDRRSRTLRLVVSDKLPRAGAAYVWVPERWRVVSGVAADAAGLLTVALKPGAEILLQFAPVARRSHAKARA